MDMQLNRTMIPRSAGAFLAFAVATAAVSAGPSYAASNTAKQLMSASDWQKLRQTAAWSRLQSRLIKWKHLPNDWDGSDGVAPSCATTDACSAFLIELEHIDAPVPQALIAGDGEISYEWSKGDAFASASFTNDGSVLLYLQEIADLEPLRVEARIEDINALEPFFQRIGAFA